MKVWRPQLNPVVGLVTFGLYTIVFFIFGAILKSSSDSVVDSVHQYDINENCAIGKTCTLEFEVKDEMKAPVYFYYQLENFY